MQISKYSLRAVALSLLGACGSETKAPEAWPLDPETGLRIAALGPLPPLPEWPDNPATNEKDALGAMLFNDPRVSGSGKTACASCHPSLPHFQDGVSNSLPDRSVPEVSPTLHRHTPSLLNIVYAPVFRWDGSHNTTFTEMMVLPFAEANMNLSKNIPREDVHTIDVPSAQTGLKEVLTERVRAYVGLFQEAFGVDIRTLEPAEIWQLTGKALAVYIRRAISRDSAFDAWNAGDESALSESAVRGVTLFMEKGRCITCHYGPLFSDFAYHNLSTRALRSDLSEDLGRELISGDAADRGKFLTPTLRSSWYTAPYFHNGIVTSIRGVIRHITNGAALADPNHDPILDTIEPFSDSEIEDLAAFLQSLTGKRLSLATIEPPMLPGLDEAPISLDRSTPPRE